MTKKKRMIALLGAVLLLITLGLSAYWGVIYAREQKNISKFSAEIAYWSEYFGVDKALVYAVIHTESSFDPQAESHAGAIGLMQMTDETFAWLKQKIAPKEDLEFHDLFDPNQSIRFGVYLLSLSLARYGNDIPTAAAAYHSGWGTVDRLLTDSQYSPDGVILTHFPYSQMNHYVNKIQHNYEYYKNKIN